MKLLVFGSTGQVGTELLRAAGDDLAVIGRSRAEADLGDRAALRRAVFDTDCDVVVNAGAYTAVDQAESEAEAAFAANRDGPGWIAEACAEVGRPLIHYSTDYVFDGSKTGAYTEDDPVCPLSVYGASKEAGESAIRRHLGRHVVLRTSWVFSAHGRNFLKTMLRLGAERTELNVVADQIGCPTAASDIAAATIALARRIASGEDAVWGTYHFAGTPRTTWHGFAEAIFAARQTVTGAPPPVLHPITSDQYPTPVKRPANSELDCSRLRARFGVGPADWRLSLASAVQELLSSRKTS
ncbi:dTDP-4-dehydrorhamnose reductase [Azospirillum sp. sgz301742]